MKMTLTLAMLVSLSTACNEGFDATQASGEMRFAGNDAEPEQFERGSSDNMVVATDNMDDLALTTGSATVTKNTQPVEIFLALDSSGSMKSELRYLKESIPAFVSNLDATGLEYQIHFVNHWRVDTGVDYASTEKMSHTHMAVNSVNGISVMNAFFNNYERKFEDSRMDIVFATDYNGKGAGNLADDFKLRVPGARVHAMVGQAAGKDPVNTSCHIPARGEEFIKLAAKTKGSNHNLCDQKWDKLLAEIVDKITSDPNRELDIQIPESEGLELKPYGVEYNGKTYAVNSDGSPFTVTDNKIFIDPEFEIKIDDQLKIIYEII